MEVKWNAFHNSEWKRILGNGRNTHLHLSPAYRRAVTAPEWMAIYWAWQKNTKCLRVLTCAKVVVGWWRGALWPKELPPGVRQAPLCQEEPVKLHLAGFKKGLVVLQVLNLRDKRTAKSLAFGFSHFISLSLNSLCLFSVATGKAPQPPCRQTACQSKLLLTLSSPAQWHRSSPGMALSKMGGKRAWLGPPLHSHQHLVLSLCLFSLCISPSLCYCWHTQVWQAKCQYSTLSWFIFFLINTKNIHL